MHKTTKRGFLKAALASGLALEAFPARSDSQKSSEQLITIIDLGKLCKMLDSSQWPLET